MEKTTVGRVCGGAERVVASVDTWPCQLRRIHRRGSRTRVVLPAPCTPLMPTKKGGELVGWAARWARMRVRIKGMQWGDLSSIMVAMPATSGESLECASFVGGFQC